MVVAMAYALSYFAAGFLLAGFSEIFAVLFGLSLLGLWVHTRQRQFLAAGAGVAVGFLVVFLAPGNAIRAAALHHKPELIPSLSQAAQVMGLFLISEVVNRFGALLLAFCIGYLCPLKRPVSRELRWVLMSMLIGLGMIYLSLFMVVFLAGGLADRHFTFPSFITVLCVGFIGVICAAPQS